MAVEDISSDKTPGVINIEIPKNGTEDNQRMALKIGQTHRKASHICIFGDCQKGKRGRSDFCRTHEIEARILSGKFAREKAIAKIAARDNQNQAVEVNRLPSSSLSDNNNISRSDGTPALVGWSLGLGCLVLSWLVLSSPTITNATIWLSFLLLLTGSWLIMSTSKSREETIVISILVIPFACFTLFVMFAVYLFASSSGGCYGVCGLSGWGGP
tara:strand:- start:956 stop:1597 length:642 start_codon:yes stop_codon:yes gene_type:complete